MDFYTNLTFKVQRGVA